LCSKEKPPAAKKALLKKPRPGSLHELMQDFCGIMTDGPPDLATNPKYFDGFGE
jgi:hypothetical protein